MSSFNVDAVLAHVMGLNVSPTEVTIANAIDTNSKAQGIALMEGAANKHLTAVKDRQEWIEQLPADDPTRKMAEALQLTLAQAIGTVATTVANRKSPQHGGLL